MISLHGIWATPHFFVWGFPCADTPRAAKDEPDATTQSDHPPTPPPFLSVADLHEALGELSADGLLASIAEETRIKLHLPVGRKAADGADHPLKLHTVPALRLSSADAIDLLAALPDESAGMPSQSLRFWSRLAKYGLSLLVRQQFVPDVAQGVGGGFSGGWRVFVSDRGEIAWLERMVQGMPPVCRALQTQGDSAPSPTSLVDSFMSETTEAVIRRSLDEDGFYRGLQQRAKRERKWELQWISSLIGPRRPYRWPDEHGPETAAAIRAWIGSLAESVEERPPELVLTLIEPPEEMLLQKRKQPVWRVRLNLRDPDSRHFVDMNESDHASGSGHAILGRHLDHRREHLEQLLSRAALAFPAIERRWKGLTPAEIKLNPHEAHAFIREQAPLLQGQGFEVRLPGWAAESRDQVGLRLVLNPPEGEEAPWQPGLSRLGLSSMMDFDWRVAIGNHELTLEAFEELVSSNLPLVRLSDRWADIDQKAARRAVQFMRGFPARRMTLASAFRMAAGAEELDAGLPVIGLTGDSWISRLFEGLPDTRLEELSQPAGFVGTLRPYQVRGLNWLAFLGRMGIGSCLADDMGLGKTIQLIALLLQERQEARDVVDPTLLFVPMSVVGNWHRELQRFGPSVRVVVHHGPERSAGKRFVSEAKSADVVLTTYGLASRDLADLQRVRWGRIALDEAQKVKNPSAHQSIAIRSIAAPQRVALTGTPLENHLSELWSILEMLNPGLLGSAGAFRRQFAVPIEKLGDSRKADQLRRLVRPFVLRRLKSDPDIVRDLPEKMEMRVYCNLTPEQAKLYKDTVDEMLAEVDQATGIRRRGLVLATLTKLKQICNHPIQLLRNDSGLHRRSGKCERLAEMLEEVVEEGDAALVFTQFKEMGDLLKTLLSQRLRIGIPFLHGGTTARERDALIREFQETADGVPIFLLSLKAGGFGLNLTKANHVFHFDRWWNPAVEAQATDRAHRIGQTRRVQVHKFVCIGTLEERIDQLLSEKSELADRIVGSGDDWLTGLSTHELRDYLKLSADAVAEIDE